MITILRNNQKLIAYSFVSYLDKGLTFLLPLSVLYLFKDVNEYNKIEYVYSVATVVLVVMELGIKGYYFYAYRHSNDRSSLLNRVRTYFNTLLLAYVILCVPFIFFCVSINSFLLLALIASRAFYLMLTGFLSYHNRLNDEPFKLFFISFSLNIFSYLFLFLLHFWGSSFTVVYFFIPQFCVVLFYLFGQGKNFCSLLDSSMWGYIAKALKYFWPSMLNVLIVQSIGNFGKVYAFKFLDAQTMASISFVLRITLLVQLAHGASLEYLSKSLFTSDNSITNRSVFKKYSAMMALNALACALLILVSNQLISYTHFPYLHLNSVLFIAYVILWCYGAYFETFFNKHGRNFLLLMISIVSTFVFVGFLLIVPGVSINIIGVAMILYAFIYLLLQLYILNKKSSVKISKVPCVELQES